jgi:uncharacterized protein DUF4261
MVRKHQTRNLEVLRRAIAHHSSGLRLFGLRELEYAAAPLDPGFVMPHAYSVTEYLLRSGKRLADGETIGAESQARFTISHFDTGDFVSCPIARLTIKRGV